MFSFCIVSLLVGGCIGFFIGVSVGYAAGREKQHLEEVKLLTDQNALREKLARYEEQYGGLE